jgi:hypothetical protein
MSEEENIDPVPSNDDTPEDVNKNASQEQTIEQSKTQSENMEVHYHPHVEKKNWKEYFLEFLMIFLAVTLGFFAENIREYISDKAKVNEYMKEITDNLKYDTIRCNRNYASDVLAIAGLDSFRVELKKAINGNIDGNPLYYFNFLYGSGYGHAAFNTSAITELKNSGFLRLIDNKKIVDELSDYYERLILATNAFVPNNTTVQKTASDVFSLLNLDDYVKSFDSMQTTTHKTTYSFPEILKKNPSLTLISTDRKQLEKLYNDEAVFEISIKRYNFWLGICKNAANQLIGDIKKEYGVKDE